MKSGVQVEFKWSELLASKWSRLCLKGLATSLDCKVDPKFSFPETTNEDGQWTWLLCLSLSSEALGVAWGLGCFPVWETGILRACVGSSFSHSFLLRNSHNSRTNGFKHQCSWCLEFESHVSRGVEGSRRGKSCVALLFPAVARPRRGTLPPGDCAGLTVSVSGGQWGPGLYFPSPS